VRHALQDGVGLEFAQGAPLPDCLPASPDLADVRGQLGPKRALEIAAAGGHSLLLIGPPGAGKSMLAQRLPGILPALSDAEALECAMLHSLVRPLPPVAEWRRRPYRAPHHGTSAAAVIGGGGRLRPGEISLAHRGVLFLDELPEYRRDVLEALREPLETGFVSIARAAWRGQFPARFQLVAAMNPCPCGYAGDPSGRCRCSEPLIRRYRAKVSGPLLDRIDLHVEVARQEYSVLRASAPAGEGSDAVAARVAAAQERQRRRGALNAALEPMALARACGLGIREHALLDSATRRLGLSARACHRIQRVARTIADLAGAERVGVAELSEAIGYRRLDREPQAAAG
jgi:magnesium chelatase family protein